MTFLRNLAISLSSVSPGAFLTTVAISNQHPLPNRQEDEHEDEKFPVHLSCRN